MSLTDHSPDLITFTAERDACPLYIAIRKLVNSGLGVPANPDIGPAASFLRALITRDHPAHLPLADLTGHRGMYDSNIALETAAGIYLRDSGDHAGYRAQLQVTRTARDNAHEELRRDGARVASAIQDHPITVAVLFTAEDLAAFQAENGIPGNWHHANTLTTVTTEGELIWINLMPRDEERHLVFHRRDGEGPEAPVTPVAMINLARLLGVASGW